MNVEFQSGDYIEDRYQVLKTWLGGMGTVYAAFDIALDQVVAIKTFQKRFLNNEKLIEMFLSEARTWIRLELHPHIVQAKSTFIVGGQPFLVVEYVDGGDLRQILGAGRLKLPLALELALQFCAGAEYAYKRLRLIHRDIKPGNLLLTAAKTLKITDFGLSRIAEAAANREGIMGTPPYMPPEQWLEASTATVQSDIYSFGVVLYEMVTGKLPFPERTLENFRRAHFESAVPNPKTIDPTFPDELSAVVLKCLEKNPTQRFFSYEDLAEQLRNVYELCTGHEYQSSIDKETHQSSISEPQILNSGDALFTIGRYSEALSYYTRLITLDPNSVKFWLRKGDTLTKLERYHEAELYFRKALELEPSNLEAIKDIIRCHIKLDKREDALRRCAPALALNPTDRVLLKLKQELLLTVGNHSTTTSQDIVASLMKVDTTSGISNIDMITDQRLTTQSEQFAENSISSGSTSV